MQQKVYCGNQPQAPQGYDRIGRPFQCLRKGYGVCLYNGRQGQRFQRPPIPLVASRMYSYGMLFLSITILFLLIFWTVYYFVGKLR